MSEAVDQPVVSDPEPDAPASEAMIDAPPVDALPVDATDDPVIASPGPEGEPASTSRLNDDIAAAFVDDSVNIAGEAMIEATEAAVAETQTEEDASDVEPELADEAIEADDPPTTDTPDPVPSDPVSVDKVPADMDIKDVDAMLAEAADDHDVDDEDFLDDTAIDDALDDLPSADAANEPLPEIVPGDESDNEAAERLIAEGFGDDDDDDDDTAGDDAAPVAEIGTDDDLGSLDAETESSLDDETDVDDMVSSESADLDGATEPDDAPVLVAATDDAASENTDATASTSGGLGEKVVGLIHKIPLTYTVSRVTRLTLAKVNAPYYKMAPTTQKALPLMSLATAMMGFAALAMAMMR